MVAFDLARGTIERDRLARQPQDRPQQRNGHGHHDHQQDLDQLRDLFALGLCRFGGKGDGGKPDVARHILDRVQRFRQGGHTGGERLIAAVDQGDLCVQNRLYLLDFAGQVAALLYAFGDFGAAVEDVEPFAQVRQIIFGTRPCLFNGTIQFEKVDFKLREHPFGMILLRAAKGAHAVPDVERQVTGKQDADHQRQGKNISYPVALWAVLHQIGHGEHALRLLDRQPVQLPDRTAIDRLCLVLYVAVIGIDNP